MPGNPQQLSGNNARYPGIPDDTEMVVLNLRTGRAVDPEPELIAHRGASGYRPEHTPAAYELAIRMCADYIEPDVVSTKDGVLVARHENEIGGTTNVSTTPRFADRRTTKTVDGRAITGRFTEDFTVAELKTLRAKGRLPRLRLGNTDFDGLYEIPTLDEVADLVRHSGVGLGKDVMIPLNSRGNLGRPTAAIDNAHRFGLTVVRWTFRRENQFLPAQFRSGTDPNATADMAGEIRAFLAAGMDGFFTDHPDLGYQALR